ncbi:hypothetical protein BU17DRAFT_79200 [Hysterangium stoloniferum]|nr:hypothetical protein BU17DRAFT_79200 [Hysterangium stoloniferum]
MGIALGGIGVVSLRIPLAWSKSIFHVLDLPSILLATFLVAIFGLIAYFTNPSEASFRAFLTELAFRQHLSRLSEAQNIDPDDYDEETATCSNTTRLVDDTRTCKPNKSSHRQVNSTENVPIVFHFANKASVSLRTPNYDFRSFAVLTFAIVSPVEMAVAPTPSPAPAHAHPPKPISWSNPSTHGAWFVGAFGRWWLGLEMNMQPRHVRLAAHDDAALRERELSRIRLDDTGSNATRQEEITTDKTAKPGASKRAPTALIVRTKPALRGRLLLQTQLTSQKREVPSIPRRPTTPPPLPKSASLPLHARRVPGPPPSPETRKVKSSGSTQSCPLLPTSALPPSQSSPAQDQLPIIADLIQQLDLARNATSELQAQLNSVHTTSAATTVVLEAEVAAARVRKKEEDTGRANVKAQTKGLDDRRRQADALKRDAEKKHKAAVAQRDGTTSRIERLGKDIEAMERKMEATVLRVKGERERVEEEHVVVTGELVVKREELKVAEEEVQMLSAKARELESAIADESARIADLKARKERAKSSSWPPPLSSRTSPPNRFGPLPSPGQLSITPGLSAGLDAPSQFRPFAESPVSPGPLSPVGASLIPSSLMHSMDVPAQHPPTDPYFPALDIVYSPVDGSHNFPRYEESLRKEELVGLNESQRTIRFDDSLDARAGRVIQRPRSPSPAVSRHRRWFTSGKERRGLNPDAKEFTLPSRSAKSTHQIPTVAGIFHLQSAAIEDLPTDADVFPPNAPTTVSGYRTPPEASSPRLSLAGSFFSSLQSAFAPSPAEREALQRALGSGSMNSSREIVGGGSITSGLERVSSNGSGGSGGSHGGSHSSSPLWGAITAPNNAHRPRGIFNPWAGEGRRE